MESQFRLQMYFLNLKTAFWSVTRLWKAKKIVELLCLDVKDAKKNGSTVNTGQESIVKSTRDWYLWSLYQM